MTDWLADLAWIDGVLRERVRFEIDTAGRIASITPNASQGTRIPGLVVPGLPNLHSHAFQRALAGMAERAGPEGDDFWRWREVMYRFMAVLTPDDVQAIAAQLYAECLQQGYTSVAEFHYLHNSTDGAPYANPLEMALRIVAAARQTGIGMRLLPVLYCRGGFGGAPTGEGQRRFVLSVDSYARVCQDLQPYAPVGVAPHSLRAVSPSELAAARAIADLLGPETPVHIHIAEQPREVAECLAWSGQRPVAWLFNHAPVDHRWCLVHATHVDAVERLALARCGAVAGLCQTTEANLGDGIFPLVDYLEEGGVFGVGSDSNIGTSPIEELRWLEYIRRLQTQRRNVMPAPAGSSIAARLLSAAGTGGAQALARPAGAIAVGGMADLVVLHPEHPTLVGRSGEGLLDAWVFSGNANPVRDVMVAGQWVVRDGAHIHAGEIVAAFRRTMRRVAAAV